MRIQASRPGSRERMLVYVMDVGSMRTTLHKLAPNTY
jgi:hypothetical protein